MALPTASTPGYALYKQRVTCDCLAEWLHYLELMAIKRGIIKYELDFLQLTGGLKQSGNTHSQGGAFDVKQTGYAFVMLCREMGAPATWSRYDMPIGDNPNHHTHGVLNGCSHNSPARYQLAAQLVRCNGLGFMGMGGKDPYPAVWPRRTWQEGIEWAKVELGLAPAPAPEKPKTVTVQKGQTLGKIAAALGVTLAALVFANPQIKNPDVIMPGQTITVPAQGAPAAPKPAPKPSTAPKPAPKPAAKPKPAVSALPAGALRAGARNATVRTYERQLAAFIGSAKARSVGLTGSVVTDGYYGTATSAATRLAYRQLGYTPNATEPGPSLLRVLASGTKATSNPAPKPAAAVAKVDASKLHKGVSSRHVTAYQKALRAYVGAATARRYNPAGATGFYGSQTQALTKAAYRKLGATPNATEPGPGLLRVLGLR